MSDGIDKGELRKVCTEPTCPVHHPKKQAPKVDASFKAEQEKRRREEALANATGIRVLQLMASAVPVRLMKRDLVFVAGPWLLVAGRKAAGDGREEPEHQGEGRRVRCQVTKRLTSAKPTKAHIGKLIVESCDSALCQKPRGRRQECSPQCRRGLRSRYRRSSPEDQTGLRRQGQS